MTDTLLDRKQVAALLHCSIGTVRRLEKSGTLRPIRISAHLIRFAQEDIKRLLVGAGVAKQ